MLELLKRLWDEDEGLLTFEWVMLNSLMVAGVVTGVSAIRDQMNAELQGVTTAMHEALHPNGTSSASLVQATQMPQGAVGWIDNQGTVHYTNTQAPTASYATCGGTAGVCPLAY
jgi:Flp pilus assembly pilin Flp